MVHGKIMRFLRRRQKKVFRCSSREEDPSKSYESSSRRHAVTNPTHTNFFRRSSSQDSYRTNSCDFSRNDSSSSLGSDGWGSRSNSVSYDPNQDVSSGSLADSTLSRQLDMAATYAPVLENLGEDGFILLPLDDFDGDSRAPEPIVKILVIFSPQDEIMGNHFLMYLRRAFPMVESVEPWEGMFGNNIFDHWQHLIDTVFYVFILMSKELLNFARQDSILSLACQEMELRGTNIVPVYLENIDREDSDFLMDLENRWGISVQRNGFCNLHCWLKRKLVRHVTTSCLHA